MNAIASSLLDQVLGSFSKETAEMPNTCEARALEFQSCDTSFEPGYKMLTLEQIKKLHNSGTYMSSFSRPHNENGRISLTNISRQS